MSMVTRWNRDWLSEPVPLVFCLSEPFQPVVDWQFLANLQDIQVAKTRNGYHLDTQWNRWAYRCPAYPEPPAHCHASWNWSWCRVADMVMIRKRGARPCLGPASSTNTGLLPVDNLDRRPRVP